MGNIPATKRVDFTANPVVSVIIPARNEEASLAACIDSLLAQAGERPVHELDAHARSLLVSKEGILYEIIVVNDGSTDRTVQIAQSYNSVRLVEAPPLPHGWTGKSNACATGANVARGRWLLFTDADTKHLKASLARSLAEAERFGAALLSYSPEQEIHGMAEHMVMPVIFAELALTYKPRLVCDPLSPVAAANGQFLLVSREAYDAVGGHAAVAHDILEDVALARLVKQSGRKLRFRYGNGIVRTRMYRSFAQLREGWTKNLALLFPSPATLAAVRALEFVASVGGTVTAVAALAAGSLRVSAVAAVIAIPT